MNLNCHIEVSNQHLAVLNIRRKCKSSYANLVICQNTKCIGSQAEKFRAHLFMYTAQNQTGTKYEIENNISRIFKTFANEGKATIRLIEPPFDIIISKADPIQLKEFLQFLNLVLKKHIEIKLHPPPTKFQKPPQEKLTVSGKSNYPREFPPSLNTVCLNCCCLKRIDRRILKLQHLHTLDLQCNKITELPTEIKHICLSHLNLAQNSIEKFPIELCEGSLSKCLKHLNIEKNMIGHVPSSFTNIQRLNFFNISCNKIPGFPPNIGSMENLNVLLANSNRIKCLPASFKKLKLCTFDLTDNPLDEEIDLSYPVFQTLSLMEWAANAIKKYRIPYNSQTVPSLLFDYLDSNYAECVCGNVMFGTTLTIVTKLDIRSFAQSTYFAKEKRTVPVKMSCCSKKCWQRVYRQSHNIS